MKRSVVTVVILLCVPLFAFAQQVWEGSCAVGAYGSFPSTGLYGASNSFPQNTLVTVEDPQTNKRATVLVIDRLDGSGLFLLLSKDAGAAIGLSTGEVTQVKVTLAKRSSALSQGPGDLPYSPDPDVFPAASAGNPNSLSFLDQYLGTRGAAGAPTGPPAAPEKPAVPPAAPSKEAGPTVSSLAPQPPQKTAEQPATAPPPPEVGSGAPQVPVPSGPEAVAQGEKPPRETALPSSGAQQVPSPTGVQPGAGGTEEKTEAPSVAPEVGASANGGPAVSELVPARTPTIPPPSLAAMPAPIAPERAGGTPVVSDLRPAREAQKPGAEVTLGPSPAVPEISYPVPSVTGLAAKSPPPSPQPEVAMVVPSAPSAAEGAPQVSELTQARPRSTPFTASVSAVPSLPVEPHQAAQAAPTGPLVSALASARPPEPAAQLAQSQLPVPSTEGLTPEVSPLAASQPPAASPPSVAGAVAVPEVASKPSVTAPGAAATQPPAVTEKEAGTKPQPPAGQPSAQQPSAVAPRMVGRIPVRPSSALAPASYYVQLGVYGESSAAVALADNLSPDYPVSVYAFSQDKKPLYKVMIGPLNSDESGTLLYLFMAQGYTDAFVRKGE